MSAVRAGDEYLVFGNVIWFRNDWDLARSGHQRLCLDFTAVSRMCRSMDDDALCDRMIGDLLLSAGMPLEDECGPLILRLPPDQTEIAVRIERLNKVAADLAILADSAGVVLRLRGESV